MGKQLDSGELWKYADELVEVVVSSKTLLPVRKTIVWTLVVSRNIYGLDQVIAFFLITLGSIFLKPLDFVVGLLESSRDSGIKDLPESRLRQPPRTAIFLLILFLPKKHRESLLGDLEEEFRDIEERVGTRSARFWYWCQVLKSLWPVIQRRTKTLSKYALFGWIVKHLIP